MKYQKKPDRVEAYYWDGSEVSALEIIQHVREALDRPGYYYYSDGDQVLLRFDEAGAGALPGDYVVLAGSRGVTFVRKAAFESRHEPVADDYPAPPYLVN